MKPKQIFLVHGEKDAKHDFAQKIREEFGYEPVVVEGNSEFELETGRLLSKEEVIREAIDEEAVENLKEKISDLGEHLQDVLNSAQEAVAGQISPERLQRINNIMLELEKASLNLGSSVTEEDRSSLPLSQQS